MRFTVRLIVLSTIWVFEAVTAGDWPACGEVQAIPGDEWVEASPASLAWDETGVEAARRYFDSLESSAVMVVYRGHLVAGWGEPDERYDMASLRKSVLSALYGAAIGQDAIDLDATVEELGIDDSEPPLSAHEKKATVRDLLTARSGIFHSAHYEMGSWKRRKGALREWARARYGRPSAPPGSTWLYNNWDFNVAAAIFEKVTGEPIGPAFHRLLARPLKMQDFRPQDVDYAGNESYAERRMGNLSDHPAYMFTMSTRDLARLGLLYLGCGTWRDAQIVPREWILESIEGRPISEGAPDGETFHDHFGAYGYMWWIDKPGTRTFTELRTREPVYFGQGYRGHYLWVAPYLDLVVAHQVATTGGIGTWGQLKRRIFGSDEITDNQFQELLRRIIAAHPEGADALLPNE